MAPKTSRRTAKPAVRERLLGAARKLAGEYPTRSITLALVAESASVSWPTARRHLGTTSALQDYLRGDQGDLLEEPGTRDRVLSAAAAVFGARGYAVATLDDVGAAAGMTKGAVYRHFSSKADLFVALAERRLGERHATLGEDVAQALSTDDPPPRLARLLQRYLEVARDQPAFANLLLEFVAERRDERVRVSVQRAHRGQLMRAAESAKRLQKAGRISERVDPDAFAVLWLALIEGLLLLSAADPAIVEPGKLAPRLVELLWNGMKRRYGGR